MENIAGIDESFERGRQIAKDFGNWRLFYRAYSSEEYNITISTYLRITDNDFWFLVAGKSLFQWLPLIRFILVAFPEDKMTEIDTKSDLVRTRTLTSVRHSRNTYWDTSAIE
jgi:hypothetical protein